MIEFLQNILVSVFSRPEFATIVISMFPIIELKGAIPIGMSADFWGVDALSGTQAFVCSLWGSCLVVPVLALVFSPIIKWMKSTKIFSRFAAAIENKVKKSSAKIQKSSNNVSDKKKTMLKILGVFAFVSVPLPLTGVWTGACIGVAVGLSFWQTVISVVLGNIIAGLLIMFVCSVFPQFTTIIFFIVIAIFIIIILVAIMKNLIYKKKAKLIK